LYYKIIKARSGNLCAYEHQSVYTSIYLHVLILARAREHTSIHTAVL
jgi:hypothetical protein